MQSIIRGKNQSFGLRDYNNTYSKQSYFAETMNVINTTDENSTMSWIDGFCSCSRDSIIIFDKNFHVAVINDLLGTFSEHSPETIEDILECLDNDYINAHMFDIAIKDAAKSLSCRTFVLHMVEKTDVICKAKAVWEHGEFGGMVVVAWKDCKDENSFIRQKPLTYIIK